jgi:hypothetical protein
MRGILVGVLLAIGFATPAEAARPFNLGTGNQPGVAVGSHGEAHVAWKRELGGTSGDALEYCRVAKGRRRCAVRHTLSLGGRSTTGDAIVLTPSPNVVHLLVAGGGSEAGALFTSTNNGATFAGPYNLGELAGIHSAVMAPAGGFTVMTDFFGVSVARYGLTGAGPASPTADLGSGRERTLGVLGGVPIALFIEADRLRTFRYGGGDLNNPAAWIEGPGIGRAASVSAAGGRRGLWVAYTRQRSFHRDIKVRKLRGNNRWGRVRNVNRGEDPLWVNLAQGRAGFVLAWVNGTGTRVRYSTSRGGRRWSSVRTLFRGHEPEEIRLALGRRGGWMAWDGNELNGGNDTVRLVPVPRPR